MNGKQSRKLRKLIATEGYMLPEVTYTERKKTKLVQVGVKSNGKPEYHPQEKVTVELGRCQRSLYQRAKRLHHSYYGR